MPESIRQEEAERKFNSCKFRSGEKEEIGEFSCCTDNRHFAYVCFRRNIEDLEPGHCLDCAVYKEKNNL